MRASLLDLDNLQAELDSASGADINIKRVVTGRGHPLIVKLNDLPDCLRKNLEHLAKTASVEIYFSGDSPSSEALLVGTVESLEDFSGRLIGGNDKINKPGALIQACLEKLKRRVPDNLRLGEFCLPLGKKTIVMGILNVTPDSFSDGGRFDRVESAIEQAFQMAEDGADIIDIGGESTRPGFRQVTIEEELLRVMPLIRILKNDRSFRLPLSIDTYKPAVAEQALSAGVEMLNDIWGLKDDPALGRVAARFCVPICLMHNRNNTVYEDLIPDIIAELEQSVSIAIGEGVEKHNIIVDPGIGFGKTLEQNLEVMRRLSDFRKLGFPILLGTSRKSMIGKTLDLPVTERVEGTAATVAWGIGAGVDIIRVHDVMQMRRVAMMTDAIIRR